MQKQDIPSAASIKDNNSTAALKYEQQFRITFTETNAEGNVSHYEYAKIFGIVRELFALDFIPNFSSEAGRKYLLKTRNASYDYEKDFYFGDVMTVRLWVSELTHASLKLEAEFVNAATGDIHARGYQQIVYTDMNGRPRRIPEELKSLIKTVLPTA
jgi:acyl-CoA thioesterase FadM